MGEGQKSKIQKSETAKREEAILSFWKEYNIFEKSLKKDAPKGKYVFYDGPPFATGLPHYGHLLAGTIKDVIPRYKTMKGYFVPRRWGWDCHGLPIENLIEKELGLKSKKDIEKYGVEKFNRAAREAILRYEREWKKIIPRSGRWVDMENAYIAMDPEYMESIWWVFGELYKKDLVKEGFKAMHICPRCETTLSNFEVNQGYKEITDISVTVTFPLKENPEISLLAWTTTPWTLPGNVALAVGADIDYVEIESEGEHYILAKERLQDVFSERNYSIIREFKGSELEGKEYIPVFEYYAKDENLENRENGWKIYSADFVSTEEGTGIVHIAPAFGADDMQLGKEKALPFIQHISKNGSFRHVFANTIDGGDFAGMFVKKKGDSMSADIEILKRLAHDGRLFAKKKITHSYPHCWRCDTPLLNYATESWYVDVPKIKEKLIEANKKIHWVPRYVGEGRFGKWLEGAREWALSRSRYWGTPIPVWRNEEGKMIIISSYDELLKYGKKSGNQYIAIRHGQSESNLDGSINALSTEINPLTEKGKNQVREEANRILESKISVDYIFTSPLRRTKETANILADILGISEEKVIYDDRLREYRPGSEFEGRKWDEFFENELTRRKSLKGEEFFFFSPKEDAESIRDMYVRMMDFLFELEEKFKEKTILIVSHAAPLRVLQFGISHFGLPRYIRDFFKPHLIKNAQHFYLPFRPFPHNEHYIIDIHKPYIDNFILEKEGSLYFRIPDVFDVWFDSSSMPYAQQHYPFERKEAFLKEDFPAQFIAEGLDQTRGWFYVLSVIGNALFDTNPYENVVVNGLILAEDGKKMSKSLKNYPDPKHIFDTSGADAMRLYLLNSPVVRAEEFAFSEKGVKEVASKIIGRVHNALSLYEMYREGEEISFNIEKNIEQEGREVLDFWIISRLEETLKEVEFSLEKYELDRATKPIFSFVDDFSTWYVRRSRKRLKEEQQKEKNAALHTLHYIFVRFAKILAPFAPFLAEEIWISLRKIDKSLEESVHLSLWPQLNENLIREDILLMMEKVRNIVSTGLQLRADAKIKVRQPLSSFSFPEFSQIPSEYHYLILEEVNVKKLKEGDYFLDTKLTKELIQEGREREFLRSIQQLRKNMGLSAKQKISLTFSIEENDELAHFISSIKESLSRIANIHSIHFSFLEKGTKFSFEGREILVDFNS